MSAALGLPFVTFAEERIRIGDDTRLYRDQDGRPMRVSAEVDYDAFLRWMHRWVMSW
ncbi:hypothetical protein [Nocardia arizonensis]|uniref:hypothetical protein n=1 Tax=Nocardia arizonensis TaxID=1141647 RepID=UPI0012E2CB38|nr:hypothetical protein [Nocardia arizonensis]